MQYLVTATYPAKKVNEFFEKGLGTVAKSYKGRLNTAGVVKTSRNLSFSFKNADNAKKFSKRLQRFKLLSKINVAEVEVDTKTPSIL